MGSVWRESKCLLWQSWRRAINIAQQAVIIRRQTATCGAKAISAARRPVLRRRRGPSARPRRTSDARRASRSKMRIAPISSRHSFGALCPSTCAIICRRGGEIKYGRRPVLGAVIKQRQKVGAYRDRTGRLSGRARLAPIRRSTDDGERGAPWSRRQSTVENGADSLSRPRGRSSARRESRNHRRRRRTEPKRGPNRHEARRSASRGP